jgi:hypothetical protein
LAKKYHGDDMTNAMTWGANVRRDLRVETYEIEAELIDTLH